MVDSAVDEAPGHDRLRRRRIILLVVVAAVVVAAAVGLALASQIKSPAEQAEQTKPPALTELTAPVQKTVLSTTVLGEAVVGAPKEFSPSTIGGGGGGAAAANQNVQQIVTRIFHRSGTIGQGTVVLEVAGQPFFVLEGTVPAYRNLEPGETGPDVAQLQADLQSLGLSTGGDASGSFGPGTSAAVDAFYQDIGYTPERISTGPKADRGPVVPLGEYTFVPRLPARIVKLSAAVGQSVSAGALTLAVGTPTISGQVSPSDAALLRPGMKLTIGVTGSPVTFAGRITSVSHVTASKASVSGGLYIKLGIKPDHTLPMSLVGQDLSLTIVAARSNGAVLAVPEAAIFASANGQTYVSKLVDGKTVRVPVRIGASGGGLLQVIPIQQGALTAGDQVVTGANYSTATGTRATLRDAGPGQ